MARRLKSNRLSHLAHGKEFPTETMQKAREALEAETSCPDQRGPVKAIYVSVWDGGIEVRTECEYDPATNIVSNVESGDVNGLDVCEREYVELPDGTELERGSFIEDF